MLHGKTIAITGIGGFIGRNVALRALSEGMKVRGVELCSEIIQAMSSDPRFRDVHFVCGDICDDEPILELCSGADVVVHTAAIVAEGGDYDLFWKVNVGGAANVASLARAAGARHFIHLSSVMVYGFSYPFNVDETGPFRGEGNAYCQTKLESEDAVMDFHHPGKMDVVIIRPGDVYGIGSQPWVIRPLRLMKSGLFALPAWGNGVINHVHVDNLVDGIFWAITSNQGGEAFNITDGRITSCSEFFGQLGKMIGVPFIPRLPTKALSWFIKALEKGCEILDKPAPAGEEGVSFLTRRNPVSGAKARALGYVPRKSLEEGMAEIGAWLKEYPDYFLRN